MAAPLKGIAQDTDETTTTGRPPIIVGAKAGGSFSQFTQPGTIITGNLGVFGRYQALPFLQVQLDLLYDSYGGGRSRFTRDLPEVPDEVRSVESGLVSSLRYLNRQVFFHSAKAQLSARLSLPELNEGAIQPQLILGLNQSFIFGARENRDQHMVFDDGSSIILSNDWEVVSNDYKSMNTAIHFGFGLDFDLPNTQVFSIEFIYDRGFTDLNDIQIGQPENIEVLRTHRFGISFSYTFLKF